MNKAEAYRLGVASGYEAGIYGDFTAQQLSDEDAFAEAAAEICQRNSESLFDAFEEGEAVGIRRAWRERHKSGGGARRRFG